MNQAKSAFEAAASFANDLGIMAEQFEPGTGQALGNVPQSFSHVGLINAALSIAERERKEGEAMTC